MPQMESLIFPSQAGFLIIFWLGYFFFIKTIIPMVSMELKWKNKILLSNIDELKKLLNSMVFFYLPKHILLIRLRALLESTDVFFTKKQVFFGIYDNDFFFLKGKLKNHKKI